MNQIESLIQRVEMEHMAAEKEMKEIFLKKDTVDLVNSIKGFHTNYLLEHMYNEECLIEKIKPELLGVHRKAHKKIEQSFRALIIDIDDTRDCSISDVLDKFRSLEILIKKHQQCDDRVCFSRMEATDLDE